MGDLSDVIEVQGTVMAVETPAPKVYQVLPAPAPVAAWLRNVLAPAVVACRFRNQYPVELRPCGKYGGWAQPVDYAPDRRIAMSSKAWYWGRKGVLTTYLHEVAHQLVGNEHEAHGAVFFATNYLLLLRAEGCAGDDPTSARGLVETMSLYDLSEPPPALQREADGGIGAAMGWAIKVARELAPSQLKAEDAGRAIGDRYQAWVKDLEASPAKRDAAAARARAAVATLTATRAELQSANRLLRTVSTWLGVTAVLALVEAFMLLRIIVRAA